MNLNEFDRLAEVSYCVRTSSAITISIHSINACYYSVIVNCSRGPEQERIRLDTRVSYVYTLRAIYPWCSGGVKARTYDLIVGFRYKQSHKALLLCRSTPRRVDLGLGFLNTSSS